MVILEVGDRVVVNGEGGSQYRGQYGTVIVGEHRSILTGRPVVEVRIDGNEDEKYGEILYAVEVDLLPREAKAA